MINVFYNDIIRKSSSITNTKDLKALIVSIKKVYAIEKKE